MKHLSILFFLLLPFVVFSQLTSSNVKDLRNELLSQINKLRTNVGVNQLGHDPFLQKAAQHHSDFIAKRDHLTHTQISPESATPTRRVTLMGCNDFALVGENILYSTPQNFPLKKNEIVDLATEMFLSWKNSPEHYANMIDPEYTLSALAFKTNTTKNTVFATHVFGKKGYRLGHQLSPNAFGLVAATQDCDDDIFSNVLANMGNAIHIVGNEVKLYHHDNSSIIEVIKYSNDGFAVDLVNRDQMLCGHPNQLDFSPIYDGILLKPVYKEQLLQNNQAKSDYRFISTIGQIPENLNGNDYSASLVFIKEGKKCRYLVPSYIPSKRYKLRNIEPLLVNPSNVKLLTSGIVSTQELNYDFNTNITEAVKMPSFEKQPLKVASVVINAFSSVEGDSTKNALLYQQRAKTIQKHIAQKMDLPDSLFHINASENWSLMNFQLSYFGKDKWMDISHDSLKNIIGNGDVSISWDSLLFAQRNATATIFYENDMEQLDSTISIEELNIRTAILRNDSILAIKALHDLYYSNEANLSIVFEANLFEAFQNQASLVQNVSAILSKTYPYNIHKTTQFIFNWMNREEVLSADAKYNLLHLYTLVGLHLLNEWDLAAQRLSQVMHPNKVAVLSDEISKAALILNLHLTYIQYFGQVNDVHNINRSFHHITSHFRKNALNPVSVTDLALFFNNWSRYDLTMNFLRPKFKLNELNEDGVFTLVQTMVFYEERQPDNHESIHEKAIEFNQTRWCNWISNDFQILRDHKLKRLYCARCN